MAKVFIKRTKAITKINSVTSHLKYIGFRSKEINEKGFFGRDTDHADFKQFVERIKTNPALKSSKSVKLQKLIFSLRQKDYDAYKRSGKDYKDLIRETLKFYEIKHGVKLDWVANIHEKDGHPHVHVAIKGVSDEKDSNGRYQRIFFKSDDFKDMKAEFDKTLDRDAKYLIHEKNDLDLTFKDLSKALSRVTDKAARDMDRENEENERNRLRAAKKKINRNSRYTDRGRSKDDERER